MDNRRASVSKAVSFRVEEKRYDSISSTPSLIFAENADEIKLELLKLSNANNLLLIIIYVLLLCASFSMGLQYAMKPNIPKDMKCHIKQLDKVKWSFDQKKNLTSPDKGLLEPNCYYYNINYSILTSLSYEDAVEESKSMIADNPNPVKCSKYLFKSKMPEECYFLIEFKLICEKTIYSYFNIFTQLGAALGAFPFGIASDIYGRQATLVITGVVTLIGGIIIPLAPNLPFFITGKILFGAGSITLFLSLLILFAELCRNKYRSSLMILSYIAWYLGNIIENGVLSNIKVWRLLELANICPLLIVIQGILFIPESPRWLIYHEQWKKAWDVLYLLGSTAQIPPSLPVRPFIQSRCVKQARIFSKAYFQYRTYITVILSGIGCLTYYTARAVTDKPSVNSMNSMIIVVFMKIIFLLLVTRAAYYSCSKRRICCIVFLLIAICFIISLTINAPKINAIALLSAEIFSITVCIVVSVYVIEIFPTSHRATALGFISSLTQFIGLAYLYYQYESLHKMSVPVLKGFFCSFCIISALITMLAPNTYQDIPDTRRDLLRDLTIAEQVAFSY